ncbi:DUF3299 domain-containing protein [Rhodoferax sp.]|uniref:DUF3299 domain-containing protein n=1 Tax=Rhodoferax sp. TaxID=50421 RepID=UPI00263117BD|nr:DUF3299 domain-containing protein [Rhodoferax sp.]MDD2924273.1 DUF3299 domain-containing protein [Rhodoferax sp.]
MFKKRAWYGVGVCWLGLLLAVLPMGGLAQLSSPVPGGAPAGIPSGTGPGVHSPNSPFKPLPQRTDVVPWSLLTAVKLRDGAKGPRPRFNPEQQALNGKVQRIQGFMMPLEPGERQKHFLLSSVPLTCSFCVPGGPESMVEVTTSSAVKYTMEPVVVEGKFSVLTDDPYGLYYRITDGTGVK